MNEFESRVDLSEIKIKIDQLKEQMTHVIVGQEAFIDQLIIPLLGNGHVLIEGVPGVDKNASSQVTRQKHSHSIYPDTIHSRLNAIRRIRYDHIKSKNSGI